jgi:hypothetical protein
METVIPIMEIRSFLTGRRGVSLPFTDYSAPIFGGVSNVHDWMPLLIRHGKSSGWKYIEIRNPGSFSNSIPVFSTYYGHVIDLSGTEESVKAGLSPKKKRSINKAAREGVSVAVLTTEDSIREYFRLHCMTRKRHGLPPQPYHFFKKIYDHVISKGYGFVALACYKGINIAGIVCFHFGGKAVWKFGASDMRYKHLRVNDIVTWETIKMCSRQGCKNFCFGRTEPDNHGLMVFKSGWGAKEQTIQYYRYDLGTDKYICGKPYGRAFYNKIFKAIPVSISRVIGEKLYRHIG